MRENHVESFDEWDKLNEKKGDTYEYGCLMVYFDFPQMSKFHDAIEEDDLYEEEDDRTFGLEDEPHVTLLYGLHDDEIEDQNKVIEAAEIMPIGPIRLKNISMFENDDKPYDVLKFDADNDALHEINKTLCEKFPYTSEFDYHPHSTIGYVKKGELVRNMSICSKVKNLRPFLVSLFTQRQTVVRSKKI